MLKTVVLAPIPSPKVSTAASVKPGLWASLRTAWRRSSIQTVMIEVLQSGPRGQAPCHGRWLLKPLILHGEALAVRATTARPRERPVPEADGRAGGFSSLEDGEGLA